MIGIISHCECCRARNGVDRAHVNRILMHIERSNSEAINILPCLRTVERKNGGADSHNRAIFVVPDLFIEWKATPQETSDTRERCNCI